MMIAHEREFMREIKPNHHRIIGRRTQKFGRYTSGPSSHRQHWPRKIKESYATCISVMKTFSVSFSTLLNLYIFHFVNRQTLLTLACFKTLI
jgi:hypothetical protein